MAGAVYQRAIRAYRHGPATRDAVDTTDPVPLLFDERQVAGRRVTCKYRDRGVADPRCVNVIAIGTDCDRNRIEQAVYPADAVPMNLEEIQIPARRVALEH